MVDLQVSSLPDDFMIVEQTVQLDSSKECRWDRRYEQSSERLNFDSILRHRIRQCHTLLSLRFLVQTFWWAASLFSSGTDPIFLSLVRKCSSAGCHCQTECAQLQQNEVDGSVTQRRWPFAAKLTCFESTYTVVEDLFSRRFSWLFLSFRSRKFGTPLFAI